MKPPAERKKTTKKPIPPRGPDKRPRASRVQLFVEIDKHGKPVRYASAWACGMAMINSPMVSTTIKAKLIAGLMPFEKPRLAEKEVGIKEARNRAAMTAGQSGEFDGLMEPPKGPRIVVDNSADASNKKTD